MPIEHIPDWETRLARQDAFWDRRIIDRPVVIISWSRKSPAVPWPARKTHATIRERWFDSEYVADWAYASAMNTEYAGDSLPVANPNLGPEVFSAFFGAELEFSPDSSWCIPCLKDWADAGRLEFSEDNFYWKKLGELTDALLAKGKGVFYTGVTDLHPGGDAVAAFRDPEVMAVDMIDHPGEIRELLGKVDRAYLRVLDFWHGRLAAANQAYTCWAGIASTRRWYVPSNDFSCMISKAMFDDMFLPGLRRECAHTRASIYHLDGPGALHHLDSLLAIPELNAIQWVYGAGKGPTTRWLDVYRKCQAAGKGIQLDANVDELDVILASLKPEGVWLRVNGIQDQEEAETVIARISRWK
jgi:hypothetical protein